MKQQHAACQVLLVSSCNGSLLWSSQVKHDQNATGSHNREQKHKKTKATWCFCQKEAKSSADVHTCCMSEQPTILLGSNWFHSGEGPGKDTCSFASHLDKFVICFIWFRFLKNLLPSWLQVCVFVWDLLTPQRRREGRTDKRTVEWRCYTGTISTFEEETELQQPAASGLSLPGLCLQKNNLIYSRLKVWDHKEFFHPTSIFCLAY